MSRSKKDWSVADFEKAWVKLAAQADDHSVPHKKFNKVWQRETAFRQTLGLCEDLIDAGVIPVYNFGQQNKMLTIQEDDQLAGDLLALKAEDSDMTIGQMMARTHASRRVITTALKELNHRFPAMLNAVKTLTNRAIIETLNEKITMAFEFLDEEAMAKMSGAQLAVTLGIMIDKRQLLSGEPTAILSVQERSNLNDLMPALLLEARRRQGVLIEGERVG